MTTLHVRRATDSDRFAIISIRWDVFVVEQHVPMVLEIDARDFNPAVTQFIAEDEAGHPVGTVRLIPDGDDCYHLGRLAVRQEARGSGCGAALVNALHEEVKRRTPAGRHARVDLDAQLQAQGFYERLRYVSHGDDTFWDAGIEHRHLAQLIEGTAEPLR